MMVTFNGVKASCFIVQSTPDNRKTNHTFIILSCTTWQEQVNSAACFALNGLACLSVQQGHLLWEDLNHVLLSKRGGEQEAECGTNSGEQAGQDQTLPGPEYCTG